MLKEFPSGEKINKVETEEIRRVDLSEVEFSFCDDETIVGIYEKRLEELRDKDTWIKKNEEKLVTQKDRIEEAIKNGLIKDGKIETIREALLENEERGLEKIISIKNKVEAFAEDLKKDVSERLGKFLPDWQAKGLKINFTINEQADFCG